MKYVCFFSNGHNGDIVHSKAFVRDIAIQLKELNIPCMYHHNKDPKLTQDLPVIKSPVAPPDYYEKIIETENILFLNTWLFKYVAEKSNDLDISVKTNYHIYSNLCEKINQVFNTNIKLKSMEHYLPFIDFDLVEKQNIDEYISKDQNKKVLFCNNPPLSRQSQYDGDMSSIIEKLSAKYKDITFVATKKFDTQSENINFTDDIINIDECDLNEIGYLSRFCDLIIGRISGPFCFCTTKDNYDDENKIFYAFGHRKRDCFHGPLDIKCKFIFDYASTEEPIHNAIDQIILENLV